MKFDHKWQVATQSKFGSKKALVYYHNTTRDSCLCWYIEHYYNFYDCFRFSGVAWSLFRRIIAAMTTDTYGDYEEG